MDNWIAITQAARLRSAEKALVIDLGYGASPVTAIELLDRLRPVRADVEVLGLEIDDERVALARSAAGPGLSFERGGFELAGHRPLIVRAANVLRQYPEAAVRPAWQNMQDRLAPDGVIVDGTCDELGRRGSWALVGADGPISLTLFSKPDAINRPSDIADRLVKALIHRNVRGERIHALLQAMDTAWDRHAPLATFGNRQRWTAMCATVAEHWPVQSNAARHRAGELTVAWDAVAPS